MARMARCAAHGWWLAMVALAASACTVAPPHGTAERPPATILHGDTRAAQFGASGPEVLNNPALQPKVMAVFALDGAAATPGTPTVPAAEFFGQTERPQVVRVGAVDYVAVSGCRVASCGRDQGLLLIRPDGGELLARLDQGGFSRYYAHGPGAAITPESRATLDGAWLVFHPLRWPSP
jgi:hypothetical protein